MTFEAKLRLMYKKIVSFYCNHSYKVIQSFDKIKFLRKKRIYLMKTNFLKKSEVILSN